MRDTSPTAHPIPHLVRRLAMGVTLATLGVGGSLPAIAAPGDLIMVSDFSPPTKIRIFDPGEGLIVRDYLMSEERDLNCHKRSNFCSPTGMVYTQHDGQDFLDVVITMVNLRPESRAEVETTVIQRIIPTTPRQLVWRIDSLDFSDVPGAAGLCGASAACVTNEDANCNIGFGEGLRIIDDRPEDEVVTVVIADGDGSRVYQLTLDYAGGNTCAHVDWVLGEGDAGWPVMPGVVKAWPNGIDYIQDDDGDYLLVDFFVSESTRDVPVGMSRAHMFRWEGGSWQLQWAFPDERLGREACLNTPHMSEIVTHPVTGERRMWYSHSRGAADDWAIDPAGYGATFAFMELGASLSQPPTYVAELGLWDDAGAPVVKFSRDQDYLDNGDLLLLDAACQNFCSYTGAIYVVDGDLAERQPTGAEGFYTADFGEQVMVEIPDEAIRSVYRCGMGAIFEMEWVPYREQGQALRAAARDATDPCPSE